MLEIASLEELDEHLREITELRQLVAEGLMEAIKLPQGNMAFRLTQLAMDRIREAKPDAHA